MTNSEYREVGDIHCSLCLQVRFPIRGIECCPTCDSLNRWPMSEQVWDGGRDD